jgi:hypothetical protein
MLWEETWAAGAGAGAMAQRATHSGSERGIKLPLGVSMRKVAYSVALTPRVAATTESGRPCRLVYVTCTYGRARLSIKASSPRAWGVHIHVLASTCYIAARGSKQSRCTGLPGDFPGGGDRGIAPGYQDLRCCRRWCRLPQSSPDFAGSAQALHIQAAVFTHVGSYTVTGMVHRCTCSHLRCRSLCPHLADACTSSKL